MTVHLRLNLAASFLVFWLVLWHNPVIAQTNPAEQNIAIDTSSNNRILSDSLLNPYLEDEAFQEMLEEQARVSFWGAIKNWLWEHIFSHVFSEGMMPLWETLFYLIILAIFIYFISRFFNVSYRGLFFGQKSRPGQVSTGIIHDVDLHTDLAERLNEAINDKNYREALRILYVQTLQKLNLHKHIVLSRGKTNLEYYRELGDPDLKSKFQQLTLFFDYVWYGEFPISQKRFANFKQYFDEYKKQLDG